MHSAYPILNFSIYFSVCYLSEFSLFQQLVVVSPRECVFVYHSVDAGGCGGGVWGEFLRVLG